MPEVYNNEYNEHLYTLKEQLDVQQRAVVALEDYSLTFSAEGKATLLTRSKTFLNHPDSCAVCDGYLGNVNPELHE